jgi:hypothetical protein
MRRRAVRSFLVGGRGGEKVSRGADFSRAMRYHLAGEGDIYTMQRDRDILIERMGGQGITSPNSHPHIRGCNSYLDVHVFTYSTLMVQSTVPGSKENLCHSFYYNQNNAKQVMSGMIAKLGIHYPTPTYPTWYPY